MANRNQNWEDQSTDVFEPVEHKPPQIFVGFSDFSEDVNCKEVNGELYIRLSACTSVPATFGGLDRIGTTQSVDQNEDNRDSAVTLQGDSDTHFDFNDFNEAQNASSSRNASSAFHIPFPTGQDECTNLTRGSGSSDSRGGPTSLNMSINSMYSDTAATDSPIVEDSSERPRLDSYETDEEELASDDHPVTSSRPGSRRVKRATSAPLLDEIGYDEIDGKSRSGKKEIYSKLPFNFRFDKPSGMNFDQAVQRIQDIRVNEHPEALCEKVNIYESHFSWFVEVQVDKGVKVEPSGRVSLKNSDKVVIGIRKSDSLPEIWVMATKPELKQKETFEPKKFKVEEDSPIIFEPWRLERKGERKCEVKVSADDTHYVAFLFTLDSMGKADLLYSKMLEASNHILFNSSMSHKLELVERRQKLQEKKSTIEELMSSNVSNRFCSECCSKYLGVFDLWFSPASWTMVCTNCSNWQRRFISSARHLWLDDFNQSTWRAMVATSNAFMSRYWYSELDPDHFLDGYELLREESSSNLRECVAERHIYGKYCNLKFTNLQDASFASNLTSHNSQTLYRLLLENEKDLPQIVDQVFNGVSLNEVHRNEIKMRMGDDKHHQEVMKFVDFLDNTKSLLEKESDYITPPSSSCIESFFNRNAILRLVTFVYSPEKTANALQECGAKLHKREMFQVIPYPKKEDPNLPENAPRPEFFMPSEMITPFYDYFLRETFHSNFSRPDEKINRPRIIGTANYKLEDKSEYFSSKCCAILDNFVLYIFPSLSTPANCLEIDLRFVYRVIHPESSNPRQSVLDPAYLLKIDYFNPRKATENKSFRVLSLMFKDGTEMNTWKTLLSDWINITQSPLLHRQPMEWHHFGIFCNYAISILIGEKLMTPTFKSESKKHWLIASSSDLPQNERDFVDNFNFKCDMPRSLSSIESFGQFYSLNNPAANLHLLINFTKDYLMVPARFIHRIQTSQASHNLAAAGLDSDSSTLSRNYSAVSAAVNSLSMVYRNTLLEIFWYFKLLVRCSTDLSIEDVVSWLTLCNFCSDLFSPKTLTNMIECFEQFFQVEESFLKERDKQTELMCRHIPNMDKKTTTIQFLFIRENWEDYEKANNYSHENNLEPVKFNEPPNFSHWTYGQLVEQLVCAITKTSGKLTRSLREAGSSDESLDSAGGEGNGHTFMLVERLTCDKHVIRILPFAHKVDPTLLPMCVLMECSMFLVGFQMLAMLTRESETERGDSRKTREFEVDHVRLKWNRKEQKPLKSDKRFHAVPMHLTVKVNLARLNRKGSSEMKQLCLSDFQLYFGALSSKSGGILKDKPKDAKLWKKSLSLIGDNYCHILTFRDTSTMMSCFWSLQHAKLGGSGVDEWIPRHRLDNIPRRSRITNPVTSGYMPLINSREQRLSTGSAASHGSLGQASYLGNGGNHSSADTASATEHGVGGGEGGNGRRTGGMSAQSVISNRLSRSVDMLQEPLTSLPVHLQETPGFVGKDKRSSSSRLTMALKKIL